MMNSGAKVLLILLAILAGCTVIEEEPKPDNLLSEDIYIDLLIELQLLEAYRSSVPPDSLQVDSLRMLIYERHGVTGEQFMSSHRYYQRHPRDHRERIISAIDSLRQQMIYDGLVDSTHNFYND